MKQPLVAIVPFIFLMQHEWKNQKYAICTTYGATFKHCGHPTNLPQKMILHKQQVPIGNIMILLSMISYAL